MYRHQRPSVALFAAAIAAAAAGCKERQADPGRTDSPALVAPLPPPAPPPIHAAVSTPPTTPPAVSPESARAIERSCTKICDRSAALRCVHATDCMPNCLAMAIGTPCTGEFADLYRCLENEPVAHWECAEDGIAAVRDGYCDREQGAAVGCLEAKAR